MKNLSKTILLLVSALIYNSIYAQEPIPIEDVICMTETDSFDLSLNDYFPSGPIFLLDQTMCFRTTGYNITFNANQPGCDCGQEFQLEYFYENNPDTRATISITIKCDVEKPECFLTDLSSVDPPGSGNPSGDCLFACEFETSTYFVPHVIGNSYLYVVTGAASYTTNIDGNELYVTWGAAGSGNINLTITNGGVSTNLNFCVDILEGPDAAFTPSATCICNSGSISFTNNSLGANNYLWDFGDGNTSTTPNPTHTFTTPGTYTVVLFAYRNNFNLQGDPLCCCTDSTSIEIIVEDLEGPDIFWVSTLCPGDKSFYWTDADMCGTYDWTVLDENGDPWPFTGDGTDSICVTWGAGPIGTISLQVTGCSTTYCSKPTTVVVPIVSATVPVSGDTDVCVGETETYTLPKWPSVLYDWTVTGGTIIAGDSTNVATIQWGAGPVGTIHVDYYSDFLGGLPNHEMSDCEGDADLTVSILPKFGVFGAVPAIACVDDVSNFSATAFPSASYSWTITPYAPFTGDGTANISVTWNTGPGTFFIQAVTNTSGVYCNDTVTTVMTVIELEKPDSIVGPNEICPGGTYTYLGYSSTPNTTLEWTVTGGSPATYTGSPITVTWNGSGPYGLSLAQQQVDPPNCLSDTISFNLIEKSINGPLFFPSLPACINETVPYSASPSQDPDAEIEWKISPSTAGSVIAGQGTLAPTIQWNNDPGTVYLSLCVSLCDQTDTRTDTINLRAPLEPSIVQIGDLCPGVIATLDASSGFTSYAWSGPVISTMEDITITSGGTYVLTTVDAFGCEATVTYMAVELPSPVASISTPDDEFLCLPAAGSSVTISAQTNPDYEFTWYCNGNIVLGPGPTPTFTHNGTNVDSVFNYCVVVQDLVTHCTKKSNVLSVIQDTCTSGGGNGGCTPESYSLSVTSGTGFPNCNEAIFTTSSSGNVIITGWNFGDVTSNTNDGSLTIAEHTYPKASYYTVTVNAQVPEAGSTSMPPDYCNVSENVSVCIPLAADFSCQDSCLRVCFTDLSTYLPGNGTLTYLWEFDDGFISVDPNPCHTYLSSGTYDVTLTVTNANGCKASQIKTITLASFGSTAMNISPSPVCVGDPVSFNGSGTGITSWLWEFGDGASNANQNTDHAYLVAGNFDVTLTVSNVNGCDTSLTSNVIVFPNPADDTISYDSTLIICDGEQVMLYGPPGPYTYLWNTGDITSFYLASSAGDYSVTYSDANNCMNETPPVTVVVLPLPEVSISGPNYICDDGCVTLQATAGPGFTYQWLDNLGNPIIGATMSTFDICDFMALPMTVYVDVTDANGCTAQAGPHTVDIATSPFFNVSIVGDTCEGSINVLSVPILPDVRYQWSTGASGLSISVISAGLYTVIGTDTITNCSHSASITINPLPDLCLVPTGCYEICDPDTICGPAGLSAYQWNMNGVPIPGETNQCLIVSMSGSYSLTGTNEFGCVLTSDTLILNVIDCPDCDDQSVNAKIQPTGGCCYSLTYNNVNTSIYQLVMSTTDADINPDLGSLDPSLSVFSIGSNFIGLENSTPTNPMPPGVLLDYLNFCLVNIVNVPQTVIFDWYNDSTEIVCSDTLIFDCPIDSDCIYVSSDTMYCEGEELIYEVTICNSPLNSFDIEYLVFDPISPGGVSFTPPFIDLGGSPITPGTCQTFTLMINGPDLANKLLCYNVVGHSEDINVNPDALCCSLDTARYYQIPGCTPCDMVYVEDITSAEDSCCYDIILNNGFDPSAFDGIDLCVLNPSGTITIDNPASSVWTTALYSSTVVELDYSGSTPFIPLGSVSLPTICVHSDDVYQLVEIKWMHGADVICRDTISLFCEPPCGYVTEDSVYCEEDGQWYFEFSIKNTSMVTMDEAYISFDDPALSGYNQTISLGGLAPGSVFGPIFILIGPPANPLDNICITVTLHELNHSSQHIECCQFSHCFILPDCGQNTDCLCDKHFQLEIEQGFSCTITTGFIGTFTPLGNLTSCDEVEWRWDDGSPATNSIGNATVMHTFPAPGEYEVCMVVRRIDINGKECKAKYCKEVKVKQTEVPFAYPNPTSDQLYIDWPELEHPTVEVHVVTLNNELVKRWSQDISNENSEKAYDINMLPPGVYILLMKSDNHHWTQRLIKL